MSARTRLAVATEGFRGGEAGNLLILSDGEMEVDVFFDATVDPVTVVEAALEAVVSLPALTVVSIDSPDVVEVEETTVTLDPEPTVEKDC